MKHKKIKFLAACFVVTLALSAASVNIFAAEMNWTFDSETKTVSVKGYGMINDASELTKYLKDAKRITVLPGVTKTDKNVFTNLGRVEEVDLPDGFLEIGDNSFNLSRNLKKITLPDSLVSIGSEAFMGCTSLENPTIPKNVTEIGVNAFADCTAITRLDVSDENESYTSVDGVIFTKDKKNLLCTLRGGRMKNIRFPTEPRLYVKRRFRITRTSHGLTSLSRSPKSEAMLSISVTHCKTLSFPRRAEQEASATMLSMVVKSEVFIFLMG